MINEKIGIIGLGNMGKALARGLKEKKITSFGNILLFDINPPRLNSISRELGFQQAFSNKELVAGTRVIILAVKPRDVSRVLKESGKLNIWCGCFDWFERLQQGERSKAISLFFWNLDFAIRKKDDFHFSHFTTRKLISLLRTTGFTPMKIEKMLFDPSTAMSVFIQAEKKK